MPSFDTRWAQWSNSSSKSLLHPTTFSRAFSLPTIEGQRQTPCVDRPVMMCRDLWRVWQCQIFCWYCGRWRDHHQILLFNQSILSPLQLCPWSLKPIWRRNVTPRRVPPSLFGKLNNSLGRLASRCYCCCHSFIAGHKCWYSLSLLATSVHIAVDHGNADSSPHSRHRPRWTSVGKQPSLPARYAAYAVDWHDVFFIRIVHSRVAAFANEQRCLYRNRAGLLTSRSAHAEKTAWTKRAYFVTMMACAAVD